MRKELFDMYFYFYFYFSYHEYLPDRCIQNFEGGFEKTHVELLIFSSGGRFRGGGWGCGVVMRRRTMASVREDRELADIKRDTDEGVVFSKERICVLRGN